jgi:diadenosine tetraphosphatase ApaH/serine/threonine PP2A family protein phosphatase
MSWFPRPEGPGDVRTLPPHGRRAAESIYELLGDPDGVEWRDRVGVVGRADGSAKSVTRLLLVRGWVAKTRLDHVSPSEHAACRRWLDARAAGLDAGLWHPEKQWAVFRCAEGWYPLTLCPELRTLRRHADLADRMRFWADMLRMALRVHGAHGIGLDLNPANFGTYDDPQRLYYIDDELYPALAERDIAGAIVARIPEEPAVERADWERWAGELVRVLERDWPGDLEWDRLCEELEHYPVTERFAGRRDGVLVPFKHRRAEAVRPRRAHHSPGSTQRLTCIVADVHANLPALEATLAAARGLGASEYLFLGDAVGYGPHPVECIARLAELENATWLRGNHDQAVATGRLDVGMNRLARRCAEWTLSVLARGDLDWLASLPIEHVTDDWMAVHGAPRDPRKFLAYVYDLTFEDNLRYLQQQAVTLCFYGHTHVPCVHIDQTAGPAKLNKPTVVDLDSRRPALVNPGSVGQPRDGDPRASFALWNPASRSVSFHRVTYDLETTLRDLRARDLPRELEVRLCAGT